MIVGVSTVLAFSSGVPWQVAVFCFAAITILLVTVTCVLGKLRAESFV